MKKKPLTQDEAARIFLQYTGYVRTVALKMAPNRELLEDIVHDVFVHFVRNADKWVYEEEKIKPLLKTITRNMARQQWRTWTKNLPEQLQKIALYLQKEGEKDNYSEQYEHDRKVQALNDCMEKLSPESRELIQEYYFKDKSYDELTREKGKPTQTIYKAMSRIRILLHDCVIRTLGRGSDHE